MKYVKPTYPSIKRTLLIISSLLLIYIVKNTIYITSITYMPYIVMLVLWTSLCIYIINLPSPRINGVLKLKPFVYLWSFNFAIIFIVVQTFFGLFIDGFGKSPYDHSAIGILTNITMVSIAIIGKELARNHLLNTKNQTNRVLTIILISSFYTLISTTFNSFTSVSTKIEITKLLGQNILPLFSHNLVASYLCMFGGPIPSIIYLTIIEYFQWLCPVLPNLKWINQCLVGILCPIYSIIILQDQYYKQLKVKTNTKGEGTIGWILISIFSVFLVWFSVGIFSVYPMVVATGSMEPIIYPGDVAIIKELGKSTPNIGDIIQFEKKGVFICHRVIGTKNISNQIQYITKGDNNTIADIDPVAIENIKGKVTFIIPKIGYPTLFIKQNKNTDTNDFQY
ncbi:signal peptidase I [Clostridiaceae bacterium M8S5]|nr:signal peptidase I [Clostridiaceae bacterium M8S5]